MLESITIENFRGIEKCRVDGLGRVNLIIGKNNAGKTAVMEAAAALSNKHEAAGMLGVSQQLRHFKTAADLAAFWLPLFREQDAVRGLVLSCRDARGEARVAFNQGEASGATVGASILTVTWELHLTLTRNGASTSGLVRSTPKGIEFLGGIVGQEGIVWVGTQASLTGDTLTFFSQLKQSAKDGGIIDALKLLDPTITGLEILMAGKDRASLFVRTSLSAQALPIETLGEGAQRIAELAIGLGHPESTVVCVDEFENGIHHSALQSLWSWVATLSARRNAQVFATTHSEECLQAAARAFEALNDDGLRVIRLDRLEHETRATVYDRQLVEAAAATGVEIRG